MKEIVIKQFVKFIEKIIKDEVKQFYLREKKQKTISLEVCLVENKVSSNLICGDIFFDLSNLKLENLFEDAKLHKAVGKLNKREKIILEKYFIDELSTNEIAVLLDTTPNAIRKAKSIILNKIRKEM